MAGVIGGATKLPSLELGVQSTTTILEPMVTRICYRGTPGNSKSVPLEDDPKKVFTRLFMDAGSSTATLDALKKKRKSVLDFVQRDFGRLEAKVSTDDRAKLDSHLTTVRQFEMSLDNLTPTPTGGSCQVPAAPTVSLDPVDCVQDGRMAKCYGDYATLGKAQMDLLVLALACDLTRVVTLQWSTAESTVYFKSLSAHGEHHLMSHDVGTNKNDLIKIDTWYAQQFSYLLDGLKSHADPDGTTLLDSSVVLWANELSDGDTHNRRDLGWIIAGKGNGAIKTGRSVKYNNNPTTNQLFVSLLNMFGSPATTFGATQFNKGPLTGLS